MRDDFLRQQVKLCKVYNSEWSYKLIAEAINITPNAFYNWLSGFYDLSNQKKVELNNLLYDLMVD